MTGENIVCVCVLYFCIWQEGGHVGGGAAGRGKGTHILRAVVAKLLTR